MEKDFIKFDHAKALKELGFEEPCFGFFVHKEIISYPFITNKHTTFPAPLYSQAFTFFRDEYNLHSEPVWDIINGELVWFFSITEVGNVEDKAIDLSYREAYKESELECLEKLIELVNNKK